MKNSTKKVVSYRAEVLVTPNWSKIVQWFIPSLKTEDEALELMANFVKKFKVDENESLYSKRFSLLEFYDGISGLNFIWSRNYREFLDELEIQGNLLNDESGKLHEAILQRINSEHNDANDHDPYLMISPRRIRAIGETLSSIPYDEIVDFFVELQQETRCASYQIKKFPKALQDVLTKDRVSYAPIIDMDGGGFQRVLYPDIEEPEEEWLTKVGVELYHKRVIQHVFETPYYSIALSIKFFSPRDFHLVSEIDDHN